MSENNKFKPGTYIKRSICDSGCEFRFEITKVTPKTVTITYQGETIRKSIAKRYDGEQMVFPLGRYSMAPTITPEDRVA